MNVYIFVATERSSENGSQESVGEQRIKLHERQRLYYRLYSLIRKSLASVEAADVICSSKPSIYTNQINLISKELLYNIALIVYAGRSREHSVKKDRRRRGRLDFYTYLF